MKKFFKCLLLILLLTTPIAFNSCDFAYEKDVNEDFSYTGVWLMEGPLGVYVNDNGIRYDITTIYARLYSNGDAEFIAFYDGRVISVAEGWWGGDWQNNSYSLIKLSFTNDKEYMAYEFKFARKYSAVLEGYGGDILMRRISNEVFEEALQGIYQDYNGIKKNWPSIIR